MMKGFLNPRNLLVIGALLLVAFLLFTFIPSFTSVTDFGSVKATFSQGSIAQGESVDLTITVTNNLDVDFKDLVVQVRAIDETSISVNDSTQFEDILGIGESRDFVFQVNSAADARDGKYSLEIDVNLPDFEPVRINLEVKS